MSFSNTYKLVKHNLTIFGIVAAMFLGVTGAVGKWLWDRNENLQEQKNQFEQYKFDTAGTLNKREIELQRRELAVEQAAAKYAEREETLKARELQYQRSSEQLKLDQQALIAEYGEKAAERQLLTLMSEFSVLGVDLNANPFCGTQAGLDKYNSAASKYTQIAALAQAYSLEDKYRKFLTRNAQHSVYFNCRKVIHIQSPAT